MTTSKILVPTDLSDASEVALDYAAFIASKSNNDLVLLHIHTDKSVPVSEIENRLKAMCDKVNATNVKCNFVIREGNIFKEIPAEACDACYEMMVITTLGIKGLKQKLLGADILKLVRAIPIPALVVQEGCKVPADGFKNILYPVGGHSAFMSKIKGSVMMAGLFDSEIHLYSISRAGDDWTEQLKTNVKQSIDAFEKNGIRHKRVNEETAVFSAGYAKQTLLYAEKSNIDLISIMSIKTQEHYYFAQADKENLLTNDLKIPVLCTSDKEGL